MGRFNAGKYGSYFRKKMRSFRGTHIPKEEIKNTLFFYWRKPFIYRWEEGEALKKFFEGLKERKIYASFCKKCRRTLVPPRKFCEICFSKVEEYKELKDQGEVLLFAISYVDWKGEPIKNPFFPALIQLEGATHGAGFFHLLGEVEPNKVYIGMKVKAFWEEKRKGEITDIRYFTPLDA